MRLRAIVGLAAGIAVLVTTVYAFQRPFREYPAIEYNDFPLPPDANEKSDFAFGRLMYPPAPTARFDYSGPRGWDKGMSSATQHYPRADRHFLEALRRLTRISVRSVEQPVNLNDEDDVYNWPFL